MLSGLLPKTKIPFPPTETVKPGVEYAAIPHGGRCPFTRSYLFNSRLDVSIAFTFELRIINYTPNTKILQSSRIHLLAPGG